MAESADSKIKNRSKNDRVVLDTNALINLSKLYDWTDIITEISSKFRVFIPTPVLYEFQINQSKMDSSQIQMAKTIQTLHHQKNHQVSDVEFLFKNQQGTLEMGVHIVNPSLNEWLAAANRMAVHIEQNNLNSSGIKKRHMDHLIYSVCRNLFAIMCTDNKKDFLDISKIASQSWYDGIIEVISLDDLIELVRN